MKTRRFFYALCLLVAAGFVWGVLQLFETRFSRGDIYPPYSSLRTDPLGTKAFYESLTRIDQLRVSRNEKPLDQFRAGKRATLFCIGAGDLDSPEKTVVNLEKFIRSGGRLVIAFYPQSMGTFLVEREKKETPPPSPTVSPEEEPPIVKFLMARDLAKRWDFKLGANAKLIDSMATGVDPAGIDPKISWHSALHFKNSGPAWKNIYTASEFPVVIARQFGEGSIVLVADSYFLSNEAMRRERHAAFLAWLIGANHDVTFDETHLGIRENPGVSTLMRRYRLGGLLAGLLVLAIFSVWKNAACLVPATEIASASDEVLVGKDSFAGFVNLLRRNIAPRDLLRVCVEEWSKFLPRRNGKAQREIDRSRRIIEESHADAAKTYREISRALSETKWKPRSSPTH
jgi:hypothetical protein